MTVPAQPARNVSVAAPAATVFPYDFKIVDQGDMQVTVDGVAKTVDVDYTLDGVGMENGGNITFLAPMVGGETVMRKRAMAYQRVTDYQQLGDLRSPTLNNDQDAPVMMIQQLADEASRALRFPDDVLEGFDSTIHGDRVPGMPLVIGSDGDSVEVGNTVGSGDLLLRGDLASSASGKGAELVKTLQSGTGAVARNAKDKLREVISPEDFGAVGDNSSHPVSEWIVGGARDRGYANLAAIQVDYPHVAALTDEIDYAALQATINYCQQFQWEMILRGKYWINRSLLITSAMSIRGPAWIGAILVATAAIGAIIQIKATASGDDIRGGRISGVQFNCNAFADYGIRGSTISWWRFEHIRCYYAKVCGFLLDDTNGSISQKNYIDGYYFTSNAGTTNAHGLWLDGGGGNGGCVQTHVGSVYLNHINGDGLRIGYCDNNIFDAVSNFTQAGGTGKAIRFMAQGSSGARNNFIGHAFGIIYAEAGTYGNRIARIISETTYVTIESGAYLDYVASDYVSADVFQTHRYRMSDQLHLPVSGFLKIGAANITTSKTYWAAASITKASGGSIACSFAPYDWNDGTVTGLRLRISSNAVESGKNVRITVRMSEKQQGETVSFVEKTQLFTVAMPTDDNTISEVDLDFLTPMDTRKDGAIFLNIERTIGDGADTATGDLFIHTVSVKHQSYGPNYFNNTDRFDVSPPYKS